MDPLTTFTTRPGLATPQSQPMPGGAGQRQVVNHAGGYVFSVDKRTQVRRFLTLGVAGGTFYTKEREHTRENAQVIVEAAQNDGAWLVQEIYAISSMGRAPRQKPAIFALAVAASLGDAQTRTMALDLVPVVCRTATTLFIFIRYVQQFRGWGRGLRRAVASWYANKPVADLSYQVLKYRQREGFTHRDALRLSHPGLGEELTRRERAALYKYVCSGVLEQPELLPQVNAFVRAQSALPVKDLTALITAHRLSWEMLPDTALKQPAVWRALLSTGMPMGALVRQLPRLTRLGVLRGDILDLVVAQLRDGQHLRKARIHPVNLLVALRSYSNGRSVHSKATWEPVGAVVDALDAAFYASFDLLEPTGGRTLLALDVSGSMASPAGDLPVSCREVTAAMAMATMATEKNSAMIVGFTGGQGTFGRSWSQDTRITPLPITPRQRLDDVLRATARLPFGTTDCALPMIWAQKEGHIFDQIVVYTDNETWAGQVHPMQALAAYRTFAEVHTKLVVVGITASDFSIADPKDPATLDVAGFDSAVPQLISDFSRGTLTSGREHLDG